MTDPLAVCRRAYDDYSAGDYERLITYLHSDVEVYWDEGNGSSAFERHGGC